MLLFGLFFITALNSVVVFALFVLLLRTLWCLGANTTTIEGWEIERHETLLRRAKYLGGVLEGPNGAKVRITRQEYPWDIGIFSNIAQGMGSWNPLAWFWPFSFTPSIESGLEFEDNGLEGVFRKGLMGNTKLIPPQLLALHGLHQTRTECSAWHPQKELTIQPTLSLIPWIRTSFTRGSRPIRRAVSWPQTL